MGENNQCPLWYSRDFMEGCTCRNSLLLLPLHEEASLESSVTSPPHTLLMTAFQLRLSSLQTGSYRRLLSSSPGSHLALPRLTRILESSSKNPHLVPWMLPFNSPPDKLLMGSLETQLILSMIYWPLTICWEPLDLLGSPLDLRLYL